jgi:hypothetical protein
MERLGICLECLSENTVSNEVSIVRSSFEIIFSKYKLQAGLSFHTDAVQIPLGHGAASLRDRCQIFRVRVVISHWRDKMPAPIIQRRSTIFHKNWGHYKQKALPITRSWLGHMSYSYTLFMLYVFYSAVVEHRTVGLFVQKLNWKNTKVQRVGTRFLKIWGFRTQIFVTLWSSKMYITELVS